MNENTITEGNSMFRRKTWRIENLLLGTVHVTDATQSHGQTVTPYLLNELRTPVKNGV